LQVAGSLADKGCATVLAGGILAALGTGTLEADSLVVAGGTLSASPQGVFGIGPGDTGDQVGSITVNIGTASDGATLAGYGSIDAPLVIDGNVLAQGGTLTLYSAVSGGGVLTIGGGDAVVAGAALDVASVTFAAAGNGLLVAAPSEVSGTISGFDAGDVIDIRPVTATTLNFLGGTLTLLDGAKPVDELLLAGSYTNANFALEPDGDGGVDIGYVGAGETWGALRQGDLAARDLSRFGLWNHMASVGDMVMHLDIAHLQ